MSIALEIFKYVETISISAAAITAAIVGFKGLKAWKKELSGKVKYEAARALLASIFKLRDGIRNYRSPFIPVYEFPKDYNPHDRSSKSEGDAWKSVYNNRWKEDISTQYREFEINLLEAEVIWGEDVKSKGENLKKCIVELRVATDAFIRNEYNGGEDFAKNIKFGDKMRLKINSYDGEEGNPLTSEINDAVSGIETLMRIQLEH